MRATKAFLVFIITVSSFFVSSGVNAAIIDYTTHYLGGTQWRYDYLATNDLPDTTITEITIFFDPARYGNLQDISSAVGWDPLVIAPDTGIPAPGFLDVLATGAGINASGVQAGFAVIFDYLATGSPGAQIFNIVDPATFAVLETGFTRAADTPVQVPTPSTMPLLLLGGIALLRAHQRKSAAKLRSVPVKTIA